MCVCVGVCECVFALLKLVEGLAVFSLACLAPRLTASCVQESSHVFRGHLFRSRVAIKRFMISPF